MVPAVSPVRIVLLVLDEPIIIDCFIFAILTQAPSLSVLVVVLHHLFKIFFAFHFM